MQLWVYDGSGEDERFRAATAEDVAAWLAEHVPAPQWRPVSEPPERGVPVLCVHTSNSFLFVGWQENGLWQMDDGERGTPATPTHWMPLPEPP
jgi:hypothetical protein